MPEKPTYEELEQRVRELEASEAGWKKMENALRENRDKYRTLFEAANDAIIVASAESGKILDANQKAEQLTGRPRSEIIGMHQTKLHPESQETYAKTAFQKDAKQKNVAFYDDFLVRHADGRNIPVEISPSFVEINGTPCVLGIFRDVSEQKKAETALKENEERLRALFETISDAVYVHDVNGRIFDFNQVACERLGYDREEMLALQVSDVDIDHLTETAVREKIASAITSGPLTIESRHRTKHGGVIDVELNINTFPGPDGALFVTVARDITVRKQAEEALRKSEARLKALSDASFESIFFSDKGVCIDQNLTAEKVFGYSCAEAIGRHGTEWIAPEDRELVKNNMMEGNEKPYRANALRKDGTTFPCEIQGRMINHKGRAMRVTALRDITEQKRAEEALRKHRNMLARTERIAHVGSWEWEIATDTVTWSEELFRIFKMAPGEKAPSWAEHQKLYHPEDMARLRKAAEKAISDGIPYEIELRAFRTDSETRFCLARGFPETGSDGRIYRLFGSLQDITDRKQAEDKLRKSEERLRTVLESMGDEVYVHDASGRFLLVNEAACRNTGYGRDELLRMNVDDVVLKRRFFKTQGRWSDFERSNPFCFETRHKRRDGSVYAVEVTLTRILMDDGRAFLALVRNITERKRAEQALQKSLAEKEVLLREIHHRVKNNMQAISGLLRMHARRIDDAHLTEIFDDCRNRIGAMSLIHEALYQSENLARIDFNIYIKKLCRNLARVHNAPGRGITLAASAADVSLDMDQGVAVGMIVAELVSNAFKHAFPNGEGGTVSIHLDRPNAQTVRLVVSDTGVGMPEDFDIQNPSSLGMRLVYGAVTRELGGTIDVENDNGARFVIRFKYIGQSEIKTSGVSETPEDFSVQQKKEDSWNRPKS